MGILKGSDLEFTGARSMAQNVRVEGLQGWGLGV